MINDGWFIAGCSLVLGWASWITKRSFGALTRTEHEQICQANQTATAKKLDTIIDKLETSEEESVKHRDAITVQVGVMESKVAVLKDRSDRAEFETDPQRRRRIRETPADGGR